MSDIYLEPTTHDISFDGIDLRLTEDNESIAQRLKIRLFTFKGEWFLNTEFGVPYHQQIFLKGTPKGEIDAILRTKILETPGVVRLHSYQSTFNGADRSLSVAFTVITDTGLEQEIEVTL